MERGLVKEMEERMDDLTEKMILMERVMEERKEYLMGV